MRKSIESVAAFPAVRRQTVTAEVSGFAPRIFWLNDRREGLHHLGYVVASLAQTTAEMDATSHLPIASIHFFGAAGDGAAAYYDTAETLGFLVEAVELPSQMAPTDFTL